MNRIRTRKIILRILLEVAFIVFLFYANLLMGEYIHTGNGMRYGFLSAIHAIFSWSNFLIAIIAGLIGYVLFEYLRRQF